ncbi:MAG TPA: AraC family transcriptional regulator [Microthrixaceae bacterium]|nr:AraC family transcriptional regulator [Microthrixaceae bacterium]
MREQRSETVLGRPAEPLRPYVERYFGYRLTGFPPGLHRGLPAPRPTFIVSIGDPIDVVQQVDPSQAPDRYRCVVGGLQDAPALIAHHGDQEGVAIDLTPLGCRTLFGMPARAMWNLSLELSEIAQGAGDELWERLQLARTWPERFAACDAVLGRLAARHEARATLAPELSRSWHLLESTHGALEVGALASEVGWSRQHLRRRFADEFGLPPKLAARVIRFDRARRMLEASGHVTIGEVAAICGYYDQPHMDREFAELAGCSPSELLAGDVPYVQDVEVGPGGR